jgi:hypothetical protein
MMLDDPAKQATFFVEAQRPVVTSMLNRIVPAGGDLPGAGDLDIASYLDAVIVPSTDLKRLFAEGVAQVEIASHTCYGRPFTELSGDQQDGILHEAESADPEFFAALVLHTYSGYYSHPRVIRLLGLDVRPPQPRGYDLEPLDPRLLDRVRQRRPMYREA